MATISSVHRKAEIVSTKCKHVSSVRLQRTQAESYITLFDTFFGD